MLHVNPCAFARFEAVFLFLPVRDRASELT
jgi:hypothetical protein